MKRLKAAEVREAFLSFYESKGHTRVDSSSLLPANDPTLLFTAAGMVQFKDVFTGLEKRPYTRAVSAQRCVRAGGKHNDLENVGFTKRHQTFFEMLGNFSFGDYFKAEAIAWAWELATKVFGMPVGRLYVTVHTTDDEAFAIWRDQIGVPEDRIYSFDEDNFWSAGDVGPCGPCSEIFFDRGEKFNTGDPELDRMGGDGDRYLEFYNLVFMQFERDAKGKMKPLPKPSVDTGMGLERITSILQDVDSNYETDLFLPLVQAIGEAADSGLKIKLDQAGAPSVEYPNSNTKFATQVIADHVRAISFLIADGLLPSNEGAGYVLRRILRRAVRFGKNLGFTGPFLTQFLPVLIEEMDDAYPILRRKQDFVAQTIRGEEEKFFDTLERGLQILNEELAKIKKGETLPGKTAFLLYDSFGFPLDLTQLIARERGFSVDEKGFNSEMAKQKERSRGKTDGGDDALDSLYQSLADAGLTTDFTGYESLTDSGKVTALIRDGKQVDFVKSADEKIRFAAVLDRSPFYAEGGGQAGDRGELTDGKEKLAQVLDVQKPTGTYHLLQCELLPGQSIKVGDTCQQHTPTARRRATAANHSATHLLHWALREVLGTHVKQAGSLVNADLLRFDFTHIQAVTADELQQIEDMVNAKIANGDPVRADLMSKDDALAAGALALFGEKYGEEVRVLRIGDYSTELCGGTHVSNSAEIRLFRITAEGGIAAGIRRITALTGDAAYSHLREKADAMDALRGKLRLKSEKEVLDRVAKMQQDLRDLEKRLEKAEAKNAASQAKDLLDKKEDAAGVPLIRHQLQGNAATMRTLSEQIRQHFPSGVIALGAADGEKAYLLVSVSKDFTKQVHAGKIIQQIAPEIDGRGGGKPDSAQAGGSKVTGLKNALGQVAKLINSGA